MDKKTIAEKLHILFCNKEHILTLDGLIHSKNFLLSKCEWYMEDVIEDVWDEREHKKWLEIAELFIQMLDCNNINIDTFFKGIGALRKDYLQIILIANFLIDKGNE